MSENVILDQIKFLCAKNDISIYQLSKNTGIPKSTLYDLFKYNKYPTLPHLISICNFFCISLNEFFDFEISDNTNHIYPPINYRIDKLSLVDKTKIFSYLDALEHHSNIN